MHQRQVRSFVFRGSDGEVVYQVGTLLARVDAWRVEGTTEHAILPMAGSLWGASGCRTRRRADMKKRTAPGEGPSAGEEEE